MSGEQAAVAEALAAHERSGISSVSEGCGDDERTVGYHAWCYCGDAPVDLEGAAQWRGTFKVPVETAGAELREHVAAAVLAALATATPARLSDEEREALGNWMRHRGVYSFGLLVDIADCVERILAARAVQPTPPAQAEAVAAVERVRALADEWDVVAAGTCSGCDSCDGARRLTLEYATTKLRAALAPTATEQVAAMKDVAKHRAQVAAEGRRE